MITAGHHSRAALAARRDQALLLDPSGASRTGAGLAERTARLAGALVRNGLVHQRVGLWYTNSFAAFDAFLAVEWTGGTRVPVDPGAPAEEARAVFSAAGVQAVLADSTHATAMGGDVLVHDEEQPLQGPRWDEQVQVEPDTPLILYPRMVTGGHLFAVATSYRNWDAIMGINQSLYRGGWYGPDFFDDSECFLTVQQLMHGTGMVGSFPFLLMGLPQVVLPRFDAASMLEAIRRHQVTATFTVPGMLTRLADLISGAHDTAPLPLRHTLYGGAPIGVAEIRRLLRTLGPSLIQLYGRFEAGWPLTILGAPEHQRILRGEERIGASAGRPIPQIELVLRDVTGQPSVRQLWTRNDMVAPDYADFDGWCSLGDLATTDDQGYIYLAGRLDNMINTGSYHVYPGEVEEAIASHPDVDHVRVIGQPDPLWGQVVTAYVVPRITAGANFTASLNDQLGSRLARYKIPKRIHLVDQIP